MLQKILKQSFQLVEKNIQLNFTAKQNVMIEHSELHIFLQKNKKQNVKTSLAHSPGNTDKIYIFNALHINLDESTYQKTKQTSATECIYNVYNII